MKAWRQLAQMLAVAILLVVAGFAPSVAQAHAGHVHAPSRAVAQADATSITIDVSAADTGVDVSGRETSVEASVRGGSDRSDARPPCSGCHCSSGTACCVSAIVPDSAGLFSSGGPRLAPDPEAAARSSFVPEALPEPPRPFA